MPLSTMIGILDEYDSLGAIHHSFYPYKSNGGSLIAVSGDGLTVIAADSRLCTPFTLGVKVKEYENTHRKKFLVYGENILDAIARDWETKKAEKEKLMSARKNAINTPIPKTPLRTPLASRNHSTMKRVASNTNISSQPSTMERKLLHAESILPHAKRSLMHDLESPRKGKCKTPFKSPTKKTRVIATTIRRKSGRASGSKIRKRSLSKTPMKLPKIKITKSENSAAETMSYDMFEDYIEKDPTCRSSIVANNSKQMSANSRNKLLTSTLCPTPPPRARKSPINSPVISGSSRKLTTKNLPILI